MARPSTNRSLDLVCLPNHSLSKGSTDLDSPFHLDSPISMEDEYNDSYIDDISGVRSLGIKRNCPNATFTAPSKLQAVTPVTPVAMNNDLLQVTKKLDFTTTDKSVAPLVNCKVEKGAEDGEIVKKEEKFMDLDQVNDRETHCRLFKSLQEQVSASKFWVKTAFNEIAEKETRITKLMKELKDANSETEVLMRRHDKEIEDLRTSFSTEKALLKGRIRDLKDAITEKDLVIMRHTREIEDSKTSFLMEKELTADRHRQKIANVKSKIFAAFLDDETQNLEAQSSAMQVKTTIISD